MCLLLLLIGRGNSDLCGIKALIILFSLPVQPLSKLQTKLSSSLETKPSKPGASAHAVSPSRNATAAAHEADAHEAESPPTGTTYSHSPQEGGEGRPKSAVMIYNNPVAMFEEDGDRPTAARPGEQQAFICISWLRHNALLTCSQTTRPKSSGRVKT